MCYPGDLLLLVLFNSQEASAVNGHHHLLQRRKQVTLLLPLAGRHNGITKYKIMFYVFFFLYDLKQTLKQIYLRGQ